MFYWLLFYVFKFLGDIFSPRTVIGRENIPKQGSFILASNHLSNLDPLLIGLSVKRRISYMAKDTLFSSPICRVMLRWVEAFPVRREASDARALRETLRRLKRGLPVVVFPEGTRKGSKTEQKMQSGIGFIAVKGGVPVVPVHIDGSDKVLAPGKKMPKRHRVAVSFGKPLVFSKEQPYPEIMACIMNEIQALSGQP